MFVATREALFSLAQARTHKFQPSRGCCATLRRLTTYATPLLHLLLIFGLLQRAFL
jgi:hypothetical protein